jgi:hypothetical protein
MSLARMAEKALQGEYCGVTGFQMDLQQTGRNIRYW